MDVNEISTKALVEELKNRNGVKEITVEPYKPYHVDCTTHGLNSTGPAVILVVTD